MSERAPKNHEQGFENLDELRKELERSQPERGEKQPAKNEQDPAKAIAEAREQLAKVEKAEKQADPLKKLEREQKANHKQPISSINFELKKVTLQRELTHIRKKLSAPDKALSKVIHQPVVRAVSEVSGKTITRPSGLLGGGAIALIGTTGYLLLAKNQGFQYNYVVFLVLFAGGFALGILLELIIWSLFRSRRHRKV